MAGKRATGGIGDATPAPKVGELCRKKCKERTLVLEKSAKDAVTQTFSGTVAIPATPLKLQAWRDFKLEGDYFTTLSILRSLPLQETLTHELSFVNLFGTVAKQYAALAQWMHENPNRKDRKITDERRKELSDFRTDLKLLEEFVRQKALVGHTLSQPTTWSG